MSAGMAASSLQPLLEGAGLDALLTHILPLLSLHELGRLAASCRRLRVVVAHVPEAKWQAAAWRSQPHPQHPIHRAASCQAYLRRQHAVHSAVSAGCVMVTTTPPTPGKLAPDLSAYAALIRQSDGTDSLQVLEMATHRLRTCIRLPPLNFQSPVHWDQASSRVALPWGIVWHEKQDYPVCTGVCLVHLQTGGVAQIQLGLQVQGPVFGGFTLSSLAYVRHTQGPAHVWSAFDGTGGVQHRTAACFAHEHSEQLVLAPAGTHAAAYVASLYSYFAVWQLAACSATRVETGEAVWQVVWSPCSKMLLSLGTRCARLWSLEGEALSDTQLHGLPTNTSWSGPSVAVLCHEAICPKHLRCYTAVGTDLTPAFVFESPDTWRLDAVQVSPDWRHVAVLTSQDLERGEWQAGQLLVFSARGQLCMRVGMPGPYYALTWVKEDALACSLEKVGAAVVTFG